MMGKKTVLLVEDELDIQKINQDMLERRGGYTVHTAMNLAEAREKAAEFSPDIIVLDIMLPDGSGLDFLRELRQGADIPVLLLTALGSSKDMVKGLQAGGDDYLPKPYDNDVLLARIESLLRRAGRVPETVVRGALRLDPLAGQAFLNGEDLLLPQKEFALLLLFSQNEGKTMSADYLYEKVWKQPMGGSPQALKTAMSRLRKKLTGCDYTINVEYGTGYRFEREQPR